MKEKKVKEKEPVEATEQVAEPKEEALDETE